MHIHMYIYIYICTYIYMYIHIYIYIYTIRSPRSVYCDIPIMAMYNMKTAKANFKVCSLLKVQYDLTIES